jgi:hypothetical protein
MILKPPLVLAAVLTAGLLGCRPKETAVSGQMFIVTRGAENIKLGDVEVLLIQKQEAMQFLKTNQPAMESRIASSQHQFAVAQEGAKRAQADYDSATGLARAATKVLGAATTKDVEKAQADYRSFVANSPLFANADYVKISAERERLLQEIAALKQKSVSLETQAERFRSSHPNLANHALAAQLEGVVAEMAEKGHQLEETGRLAKEKLDAAQSRLVTVKTELEGFSVAEECLVNFSPAVAAKTRTDADGKFSITFPRRKAFTIFAKATRTVMANAGTENYFWLVDAPVGAEKTQVFLSNNNLASADPDGYFKFHLK